MRTKSQEHCPIVETAAILGRRWEMIVVRSLLDGPKRFNELRGLMPGVSAKSLTASLRHLEKSGVLRREVSMRSPISVSYSLTAMGSELNDLIESMRRWGNKWLLSSRRH